MRMTTGPRRPATDHNANWDSPEDDDSTGGDLPAHIDSPLESLGKAITDPAREAAGEVKRPPAQHQRK